MARGPWIMAVVVDDDPVKDPPGFFTGELPMQAGGIPDPVGIRAFEWSLKRCREIDRKKEVEAEGGSSKPKLWSWREEDPEIQAWMELGRESMEVLAERTKRMEDERREIDEFERQREKFEDEYLEAYRIMREEENERERVDLEKEKQFLAEAQWTVTEAETKQMAAKKARLECFLRMFYRPIFLF
jgi:hypothetical protein